jgi:serine/threonine-protein kinase
LQPSLEIGAVIAGKFLLKDVAGRGGMATVYRAEQTVLGRSVAVKVLDPELAADAAVAAMFLREARAASRINHPNIVSVIDFGQTPEGVHYLVMEYLKGQPLSALLADEFPLPLSRVTALMSQVLDALEEAHSVEVVHRDLKPDNILIERLRTGADLVKVCDFGIARLLDVADEHGGIISGTPEYMSPEQVRGAHMDYRTDLYSAGVVLYELLTGSPPFVSDERLQLLLRHCDTPPTPPSKARPDLTIPPALEEITLRALAKEPADRFQSAAEFREALLGGDFARAPATGLKSSISAPQPKADRASQETVFAVRGSGKVRAATRLGTQQIPLVGRDEELRLIERLVAVPYARSLVLAGPPGSGKTRLGETAVETAIKAGYRAIRIGPDPRGAAEPWWPIRRAIVALLELPMRCSEAELRRALGRLGPASPAEGGEGPPLPTKHGLDDRDLVPGLSELFQTGGVSPDLELAVRRRECEAAALRALRGASLTQRTVLVFEDVDRFDRPSQHVIERLVESPGDSGLFVIATGAGEGIDEWTATESIVLGPLPASAVRSLVTRVVPAADPSKLAESEHSPLQVREYLRQLEDGAPLESASLGDLILGRLRALPQLGRRILQTVAVFGQEAPRKLVEELIGAADVAAWLEHLVGRGFLQRGVAESLVISHLLLRDLVYDDIPVAARRELHGRVLAVLEQAGASPQAIAYHTHAAGDDDAAVIDRCEAAGLDCQKRFDDHAAVVHYRHGWEVARWAALRGDDGADEQLARLAYRLGDSMLWTGQIASGEHILREGIDYADPNAEWNARIQRALARAAIARGDAAAARAQIEKASGAAIRAGDPQLVAEMYMELSTLLTHASEIPAAIAELEEGIALCTGGDDETSPRAPRNLWRVFNKLAELKLRAGDIEGATRASETALRSARALHSLVGEARSLELLAEIRDALGNAKLAEEHRRAAVDVMRRLGDRRSTAKLLVRSAAGVKSPQAEALLREARELAIAVEWDEGARHIQANPPSN